MFGINESGETCSITVRDFQPFFFIKGGTLWTQEHANKVLNSIRQRVGAYHASAVLSADLVRHQKLYGFTGGRTYPFVKLTFRTVTTMNKVKRLWFDAKTNQRKPVEFCGVDHCELYESNIPPLLRFFHIYNLSPSGWISLLLDQHIGYTFKKKTTCTFECIAPMRNISPQPDKETLVPYKICSFDIEASSSHGDFPLPVKTYKRLASNLMDIAARRGPIDGNVVKRVVMTAFGMDHLENVDVVFPKEMPTKDEVKAILRGMLTATVHQIWEENKSSRKLLDIDRMFHQRRMIEEDAGGDDEGEGEDEGEPAAFAAEDRHKPFLTKLTLLEVVNHPKLTRDVKIQVINEFLTSVFPHLQGDQVTFIGSTFLRYGDPEPYLSHCLVVGDCDPVDGVVVESAPTERDMLLQWRELLLRENPDVIIGYNIFGFDWEFMFRRSQETGCVDDFLKLSRNVNELSCTHDSLENTKIVLATGEYDLHYPKLTGRLQIDLYTYFRRDFNLASYKLDDVASSNICDDILAVVSGEPDETTLLYSRNLTGLHVGDYIHIELSGFTSDYYQDGKKFRVLDLILNRPIPGTDKTANVIVIAKIQESDLAGKKLKWGMAKDDMTPQDIFRLSQGSTADRALVAKYCVQDCNLVHHLMRKLDVITGFVEMSRICSVPVSFLVFRGQGIKLTSFVAKKCREKNTLMPDLEKSTNDDGYEGAIVLRPKCAMYMDLPVACVDYSSLYPSSMISQNYSHDSKVWTKEYNLDGKLIKVTGERNMQSGQFFFDNLPGYEYIDVEFDTYRYIKKTPTSRAEKTVVGKKICRWVQLPDNQKSIMPSILEELLSARKKTRKAAEQETDPFMANILDKRQLGYKVTANSLYGQCGAKTSTFYEQDVAASTTATGRAMIMYAKSMVEEVYGNRQVIAQGGEAVLCKAEYVYGDSVAGYTPVYVRVDGETLDILTMEQMAVKYGGNRWRPMLDKDVCEFDDVYLESWSDTGWTRLYRVIRHRLALHKKMYRVRTETGLVDVTDDHSLLRAVSEQEISPRDVVVGETRLLHHPLPLSEGGFGNDEDDKAPPFVSGATHWTFQNAMEHHRYFPRTTVCMGNRTQIDAAHLVWLAADKGFENCRIRGGGSEAYQICIVGPSRDDDDLCLVTSMEHLVDFPAGDYVYDFTTENHHFSAGIGTLVVHNTDSVFFTFNLEDPATGEKIRGQKALEVTIEIAQEVAKLCTQFLKPPMELSYEKTLMPFILLSKKRYVGMLYETNPHKGKLKYMGLSLKRRDSCDYLKDVYGGILNLLMSSTIDHAMAFLDRALTTLIQGQVPMDKLTVTKALKSDYKNPLQIGHWVLAERMGQRDAGNKPKPGDRMRFVFIQATGQGGKKPLMGDRIETPEYVASHPDVKVDYAHYITNQLMKPLQQLFGLALVPIWKSRNKMGAIRSYQHELAALERESGGDLDVFMKKKEKYCSEKIKTLIFEKYLVQISNDQQRLQSIMSFFAPKV